MVRPSWQSAGFDHPPKTSPWPQVSHPHKSLKVPTTESTENTRNLCAWWVRDTRNSVSECDCDREVRKVRSWKTLLCFLLPHSISFTSHWLIHYLSNQSSQVSSGRRLSLDFLRHLFGTVVGQTQAHDGQHHGYLVDGTVLWLRLHLAGNLPLQGQKQTRQRSEVSHRCKQWAIQNILVTNNVQPWMAKTV